jgi:hypothetical protein
MKIGTYLVAQHVLATGCTKEEARAAVASACEIAGLDPAEEFGGSVAPAASGGTSGTPRDLDKLKEFVAEGEWNLMRRGRPPAFRKNRDGSDARPGYCQGSKTGSCGDDFPDHDAPYAWRAKDQPGGPATICAGCFEAAGGVEKPYVPKQQDTAPVVADNEELPF